MRCHKMHATITVKRCLANRVATGSLVWHHEDVESFRYAGCKDCDQGMLAASGKLDDDDIEELKQRIMEERGMRKKKPLELTVDGLKQCVKCKEPKPLIEFSKKRSDSDDVRTLCKQCVRDYQITQRRNRREVLSGQKVPGSGLSEVPGSGLAEVPGSGLVLPHALGGNARPDPITGKEMQAEPTPAKVPAPACIQEADVPEIHFGNKEVADELPNDEHILILDFSCYPEVLEEIKVLALDLERPPEVQARYMLRKILVSEAYRNWIEREIRYSFTKEGNAI